MFHTSCERPLASLRSVGEVGLQLHQDDAGYRDIIGSMLEEVTRLSSMTDTLLTISRAESGEIKLMRTEFPLISVVQETVSVVTILAEEKEQTISIEGDSGLLVTADRGFLRMALMNLVDNAVKYSPHGASIRVKWALGEKAKRLHDSLNCPSKMMVPESPKQTDSVFSIVSSASIRRAIERLAAQD